MKKREGGKEVPPKKQRTASHQAVILKKLHGKIRPL